MNDPAESTPAPPPSNGDPRLQIPEVLRRPVQKPELLKEYERNDRVRLNPNRSDITRQATGWAIAMNFVWTVAAGGLLGWGVQWIWPKAAPWGLVGGLLAGIIIGMGKFIRDAVKANNQP